MLTKKKKKSKVASQIFFVSFLMGEFMMANVNIDILLEVSIYKYLFLFNILIFN